MKTIFTLLVSVLTLGTLCAQDITITPNPITTTGLPSEFNYKAIVNVKNTSDATLNILWVRDLTGIPADWTNLICDANLCYSPGTDACPVDKPSVIMSGDSADFFIEIRPNNVEAEGTVLLNLIEANGTALGTVEAIFELSTSSTIDPQIASNITLYPNPASAELFVKSETQFDRMTVVDAAGRVRLSVPFQTNQAFYTGQLQAGSYYVGFQDAQGNTLATKPLIIR